MHTPLVVSTLAAALALVSLVPAAHAESGPVSCGVFTDFLFYTSYHCTVNGAGVTGTVNTCPDPFSCWSANWCMVEVSPLTATCNFP